MSQCLQIRSVISWKDTGLASLHPCSNKKLGRRNNSNEKGQYDRVYRVGHTSGP